MYRMIIPLAVLCAQEALGQWHSFQPLTKETMPVDVRLETVENGKIVPKETRVEWYGFTLKGSTNIVSDRFQYPVADPTLAPDDEIVQIQMKDVTDAEQVMTELRSVAKSPISIKVKRTVGGQSQLVRIELHRASSLTLKAIFDGKLHTDPPPLMNNDPGCWGSIGKAEFTLTALTDRNEPVYTGYVMPINGSRRIPLKHVLLRGWNFSQHKIGTTINSISLQSPGGPVNPSEATSLSLMSGSSGLPGKLAKSGAGFVYSHQKQPWRRSRGIVIGVAENEIANVDGKELHVNVIVNMK